MKNKSLKLSAVMSTILISIVLASCNGNKNNSKPINEGDPFKVTFFNGFPGGGYFVETVNAGDKVNEPSSPSREGYTFGGWTTDYEGNEPYNFDGEVLDNIQIYGQWIKNVNIVTLKFNTDQKDEVIVVEKGAKVNEPEAQERDGFNFTGWYLDALCTEKYDFSKVVDEDITLYCGWERSAISVTFNPNYTGSASAVSINSALNTAVEVPSTLTLERRLYAFVGWFTKAFPGAEDVAVDLTKGFNDDVTLYAKWTRSYYEVTFKSGVNGIDDEVVEIPVSSPSATAPTMVREGYTLDDKWYRDSDLTTEANLNNINDDMILYAKWNINHYKVKFDLNYLGATGAPSDQDIEYQGNVTRPTDPLREGYTFLGWFVGAGDEASEFNIANTGITENKTLYAHWAETLSGKVKVTFNYVKKGATVKHAEGEIDNGTAVTSSKMPKDPTFAASHDDSESYIFVGWYTDQQFKNAYDPNKIITEDTTIYGRVLKRNTFEAEYVDLTDKHGVGSSVELNEEAMIFTYEKIGDASNQGVNWVSNGYYIAGMYYEGFTIEFGVYSSVELNDVVFSMRVSSEFHELIYNPMTPETFGMKINSEEFEYEIPLVLPEPNLDPNVVNDPSGEKTPFVESIMSYHLHLDEGWNTIEFEVRNSHYFGGGTFNANAPMIDCLYIYADENVTMEMDKFTEFVERKEGGN